MINHARTLLLNTAPDPVFRYESGNELIDPTYRPIVLPGYMQELRRILFGATPDRLMLNYRCRQYLQLLHSTDLLEFVTRLDPRITYSFDDQPFLLLPTRISSDPAGGFTVLGDPYDVDSLGIIRRQWLLEVTAQWLVKITDLLTQQITTVAFSVAEGLSSQIALPGVNNTVILAAPEVSAQPMHIDISLRPTWSLGSIQLLLRSLGEPVFAQLFSTTSAAGQTEPLLTFRKLWYDHQELAYALGGLLLALVYKTEALR